AGLHLEAGLDVVDRLLEGLQRIVAGLLFDDVEALIKDALRRAPFADSHHTVDELADERALIERIRRYIALWNFSSTWHLVFSSLEVVSCQLSVRQLSVRQLSVPSLMAES